MLFALSYIQEWSDNIDYIKHSFIIFLDQVGIPPKTMKLKNIPRIFGNGSFSLRAMAPDTDGNPWRELIYSSKANIPSPSIFAQARAQYPSSKFAIFGGADFLKEIELEPHLSIENQSFSSFKEVATEATSYIADSLPTLMLIQLPAPIKYDDPTDLQYLDYVKAVDQAVGDLLDTIYNSNIMNESHIILTSNHGVNSTEVIWACQGPFVPLNAEIIVEVSLSDTAVTSAYALDLIMSSLWEGSVPYLGDGTAPANRMIQQAIRGFLLVCGFVIMMIIVFSITHKISDDNVALSNSPNVARSISYGTGLSWINAGTNNWAEN